MALIIADRVKEDTTTTGTGTYTLGGALSGFEGFATIGDGNTTYYACTDGTDFEVGIGTYTSSTNTLARTTILQSSNSDAAVNWGSGTKRIFCTLPAEKAVFKNASDHVAFADNEKAIFGAGSDLQIYHDGTHSYVLDNGTGNLRINTDNQVQIRKHNDEAIAYFNADGSVLLYHDSNLKLATSASGVDVTGTVTADGLTVDGNATITANAGAGNFGVTLRNDDGAGHGVKIRGGNNTSGVDSLVVTKESDDSYVLKVNSTGDISFYEDTGTTPKLAWSASNERLTLTGSDYQFGIAQGTNQPWYMRGVSDGSYRLHLNGTGDIITATSTGISISGNIAVSGTVDGRNIASDGTKLDGIESGATADQTASEILTAIKTVDGSGSGLDADLLDGQQGSYYLNTSTTFGGDVSGTYNAIVVADDSHFHHRLDSTDDRDMKPNTSGIGSGVQAIKPFFSSFGGMTGTANSTYLDVLAFDTYSDSSGGGPSAITFHKGASAGDPQMYIWKAGFNDTTWSTGQRVFADNYHPNADKWTTARTLSLTGDVTGNVSWDGSGNVSMTTTVGDDSHNHILSNIDNNLLSSSNNLNDYTSAGFYKWSSSTPTNAPDDYTFMMVQQDNGQPQQWAFSYGGATNTMKLYARRRTNSVWDTSWTQFFSDHYHPNADKWTTARTITLAGDLSGSVSIDGSSNVTLTATVLDDSHDLTWANIDGETANAVNQWGGLRHQTNDGYIDFGPANTSWAHIYTDRPAFYFNTQLYVNGNVVWNSGNDGSGSGLDADLLDGLSPATTATANTIVQREASGHIYGNYILGTYFNASSGNSENPTIGQIWTQSTADNYLRKSTPAHFISQLGLWTSGNDGSGSGLDADLLDGQQGVTHLNQGTTITSNDWNTFIDGSEAYWHSVLNHTGSNRPSGAYTYGIALSVASSGQGKFQLYVPETATAGNNGNQGLWYRSGWNTAYRQWAQIWDSTNDGSGSGLDADLLDGVQGSSYLRSDANDSMSANLTFGDDKKLIFGADSDLEIFQDHLTYGSGRPILQTPSSGGMIFQAGSNGIQFYNYDGSKLTFQANTNGTRLYYDGSQKLLTVSGGVNVYGPMYDGNNTAYYVDPASTSSLYQVDLKNTTKLVNYVNSTGNAIYHSISGTGASILYWKHGTSNANLMYLDSSGNLTASGNVTAYSDIKLKDDIQVIDNAIDKVKQIRGVTFTRNDMHDDKRQTGVIAQEVEQVLPEVVTESDYDGIKSVAYGNMVGLLIEAIKEQQKQIEALQEQINGLAK